MATMNFSIPNDVKERFNRAFAKTNKSAVVTQLLEEAIDRVERKRRSDEAVEQILAIRQSNPAMTTDEALRIREELIAESDAGHGLFA